MSEEIKRPVLMESELAVQVINLSLSFSTSFLEYHVSSGRAFPFQTLQQKSSVAKTPSKKPSEAKEGQDLRERSERWFSPFVCSDDSPNKEVGVCSIQFYKHARYRRCY